MHPQKRNGALVVSMLLLFCLGTFLVLYLARDARRSRVVPAYSMVDHLGKSFHSKQMEGKVCLVHFFLTNCKSMCPVIADTLAAIQDEFMLDDKFLILSHSLDPERDSVPALKAYADKMLANPKRWLFLRNDTLEQSFAIANGAYFVSAKPDPRNHEGISHGQKLVLVDKQGRIRGYYDVEKKRRMHRLRDDIKGLIAE